jgi:hypothetical protein
LEQENEVRLLRRSRIFIPIFIRSIYRSIYAGTRKVDLVMVRLPMGWKIDDMVAQLGVGARALIRHRL